MDKRDRCLFQGQPGRVHSPLGEGVICLLCHETVTHELARATDALEQTLVDGVDEPIAAAVRQHVEDLRRVIALRELP